MIKYFNYILIFILIIHLLQFISNIYTTGNFDEYFDIIWNYPTRINNYVYDIRGYPDQYCLDNSNDRKIVVPCFYKNNNKFNIDGKYIKNDYITNTFDQNNELNIQPYVKNLF
jgi:hypothetical protein